MKTKIRFLISTLNGGGAEKVLVDLLNLLDADRYEISLVTITGGVHAARLAGHVRHRCLVRTPFSRLNKLLGKIIMKLSPALFAGFFLRGEQDIEVAYLEGLPTRFLAAKKCKNAKKLAFVHCDLSAKNLIAPFYGNVAQCLAEYRSFSRVCFVSQDALHGFETAVGSLNNGCVIHNINDYDRVRKLAQEKTDDQYRCHGLKLIAVGRLTEPKAYDRLLRVIGELEHHYDLELWIVGEGDERPMLEEMTQQKHIRSVRLLGYRENPYCLMRKADLFVCSSIYEGYSTVVTEALALGLPVLTTDCAGMAELLDGGKYGKIVENSEEGLKRGLADILEYPHQLDILKTAAECRGSELTSEASMAEYRELFS